METAFALLDPQGFDAIDEIQDLPLKPQQLGPRKTKLPVVVGEFLHGGDLFRWRRDVLRPALATVTQHGAGVGFALAQWQVDFPQRRRRVYTEPGRSGSRPRNASKRDGSCC